MPEPQTIQCAKKKASGGRAPSTQVGEFVREELYADIALENAALRDVIAKKLYGLLHGGRSSRILSRRAAFRFSGPVRPRGWVGHVLSARG